MALGRLLLPPAGRSAVTRAKPVFDATARQAANNVSSMSWSHTVGSLTNGLCIVTVAWSGTSFSSNNVTGVTLAGVAMTLVPSSWYRTSSATARGVVMYYALAPTSGSKTIQVTLDSATSVNMAAISLTYSGVDQSIPFGTANGTQSTSTNNISAAVTTAGAHDMVLAGVSTRNAFPNTTNGLSYINDYNYNSNTYVENAQKTGTGGSDTGGFSWTTADNAAMCIVPVHGAVV